MKKPQQASPDFISGMREALRHVPTNWCDPMLSGDQRVIQKNPSGDVCQAVQAVLIHTAQRISDAIDGFHVRVVQPKKRKARKGANWTA